MKKIFKDFKELYDSDIFKGIEADELETMLSCLGAKTVSYKKGAAILLEGDPADSVGIVISGTVHIIKEDFYGNRSIMAKAETGELFGEVFACADLDTIPVSVFAAENSEIMFINCKKVLTVCNVSCTFHNILISNLLRIVSEKALFLNQKIDFLSKRNTREKILAYLSAIAKQKGTNDFTIPFNRQELADFLCVERSAMSAELSRMQRDGLIEYSRSHFRLL